MTAVGHVRNTRKLGPSIFIALLLIGFVTAPSDAAKPLKISSTLISCPDTNVCGSFYTGVMEPLTKGQAKIQTGGSGTELKIKVVGAQPR